MKARDFFNSVAVPNVNEFLDAFWSERLAVNAILTLDACVGIIHAELEEAERPPAPDDHIFRDQLAEREPKYRIIRDAAFALKHGRLRGKKQRVVVSAQQVGVDGVTFDDGFFLDHDFLDGEVVFIEVQSGPRERAEFLVGPVKVFLEKLLDELQL